MVIYHKELAAGRWFELTLIEQLANIGSEVHRAIKWFKEDDKERFQIAFEKALELFDLTLEDERWKGRRKEIGRSREFFCSLFQEQHYINHLPDDMEWLDNYFLWFGIRARLESEERRKNISRTNK
jgi:hypothetical protein